MGATFAVFGPAGTAVTVSLPASTSSSRVPLQAPGPTVAVIRRVRVYNSGTVPAFIEFGGAAVAATVPNGATGGGVPIAPGAVEMFTAAGSGSVAAITSSGATALYFTPGEGA